MDLNKNLAITSADQIKKIIQPLKEAFGIQHFRYIKLYPDGSRILLSDYPDQIRYIYNEKNYLNMWFDGKHTNFLKEGWHFRPINSKLDTRECQKIIDLELRNLLNLSEGMAYVETSKNSYEIFSFDSNDPSMYAVDKKLLYRFILYFKNEARKIITQAEKEKIFTEIKLNYLYEKISKTQILHSLKNFLNHTEPTRYYLSKDYQNVYLTKKEVACINWMIQGKNIEEIAMLEQTSTKTICYHVENIKVKLNCHKQTEIIKIILQSSIHAFFPE